MFKVICIRIKSNYPNRFFKILYPEKLKFGSNDSMLIFYDFDYKLCKHRFLPMYFNNQVVYRFKYTISL